MPKEYSPLLDSLVDWPAERQHERKTFKTALQALDLYSVFDIIRWPRSEFIEQLAKHSEADGGEAYDNAVGYATQIERLDRERNGEDTATPRSKRGSTGGPPTAPTYAALFEDNGDGFCSAQSLAAVDSPAAYLRALYRFALQVEQTGRGTQPKITLAQRRPAFKNLIIDTQNTHHPFALLTLVNETLSEHIQAWLNNNRDLYKGLTIEQVLAKLRYPFQLPFDLTHQQCVLGLGSKKPGLGTLNYRISLKLPYNQQPENKYGTVQQEAYAAQCLLTQLSPAQQSLLTDEPYTSGPHEHLTPEAFLKEHYGHSQPISEQQQFMRHTGLNAQQLNELLAQGNAQPHLSANVTQTPAQAALDRTMGARFINGPLDTAPNKLRLALDGSGQSQLQHVTVPHLDRLQRMIRLQRWLDLPFAEVDTFLYSTMACEGSTQPSYAINHNNLRALGVFRYLSQRYTLALPTFSAWLHLLPVHGVGARPALFDEVFNPPGAIHSPLALDHSPFTDATLYHVCEVLGLDDTPSSLGLIKSRTQQYLGPLVQTIATVSSFYRQASIARLFGLSVMACDQLAYLLGGEDYRQQLIKPGLRATGINVPADFLDVLMQLDWAVSWLKDTGMSVQQLRQQLLLEPESASLQVKLRLKQVDTLLQDFQRYTLPHQAIEELNLPQPEAGAKPLSLSWGMLLAKTLLKTHAHLPRQPKLEIIEKALAQGVDRTVTLSPVAERNEALKATVKQSLNSKVQAAYTVLQPVKETMENLLKDTSQATAPPEQLKHALKQIARTYANALGSDKPEETLKHLLLFLPDAETLLQLPVNHAALQTFLLNPHWLDTKHTNSSILRLTLGTLYLFQRFSHCSRHYGIDQETLLDYLKLANVSSAPATAATVTAQANRQLSALLGWNSSEVAALVNHLPEKRVISMAELDWLMRCHEMNTLTGLSAPNLLLATDLTSTFSSNDWTQVANAIMATHSSSPRQRNDHV
ncbi:Tc toxin subunit A [Pseudomonas sp.]|uniref:Tc toxin subunit A n=1 Tax=Pseudomonas sp. TaxID=306 RepID=UPI0026221920|nr:Tc toxin subunit A [Pseudomonas sp.]